MSWEGRYDDHDVDIETYDYILRTIYYTMIISTNITNITSDSIYMISPYT